MSRGTQAKVLQAFPNALFQLLIMPFYLQMTFT